MERFWLKGYPAGVPADVDVTQYRSLPALLEDAFRKHADRNAFIFMDIPSPTPSSTGCRPRSAPGCRARGCRAERAWRS